MKGSIRDLAVIIFFLVSLVISGFIVLKIYTEFKNKYETIMNPSQIEQAILDKGSVTANIFINSIPFLIIASGLGAIVLAFLIPSHPIFLPISIIALIINVILSIVFSNILWDFINSEAIINITNQYPLIVSIVQYFPYILTVIGFVLIIVMYSKSGSYE